MLGHPMEDQGDLDFRLEHPKAALDVGQSLVAAVELGGVGLKFHGAADRPITVGWPFQPASYLGYPSVQLTRTSI
jgi:hypothetical protein